MKKLMIDAVAPLAKGGKCPETVFEIDADYAETLKGGSFALYLLDTRVSKIELKVEGIVEDHDYFVVPGASPSDFKPALATKPNGDTFTFDAPADSTFFKVIGARKFR